MEGFRRASHNYSTICTIVQKVEYAKEIFFIYIRVCIRTYVCTYVVMCVANIYVHIPIHAFSVCICLGVHVYLKGL